MFTAKKIKVGKKYLETFEASLQKKNFILIRGRAGYIMCGYLNLRTAEKFGDAAVKIVGVATLKEALKAKAAACTRAARKIGIYQGQPIKQVIRLLA